MSAWTPFMKVSRCCCCVPLRWGSLIFAILYLLASLLLIIVFGAALALAGELGPQDKVPDSTIYSFWFIVLSLIFQFVAGICLIMAIFQKSPNWMVPWICVSFLQSVGLLALSIVCNLVYVYQINTFIIEDNVKEPIRYAVYATYAFILYYAATVVNSYKRQLYIEEAARNNEPVEMAPLNAV